MYEDEVAIGIDFGTTFSCMAVLRDDDNIEVIPNELGENITPSIVSFLDERVLVGEQTLIQLIKNPKKTIYSIKRLIGRSYDEIIKENNSLAYDIVKDDKSGKPKIRIEKKNKEYDYYYPEYIAGLILFKLKHSAEQYLGQPITKAVITIPAYFNNEQRASIRKAAFLAGLNVLNIINEPTAASLAYGLNKKFKERERLSSFSIFNEENIIQPSEIMQKKDLKNNEDENEDSKLIIVFDLGGGTLDVTLLKILDQEIFDVYATSGNSHLGGDDFDKKIIDYCLKKFCDEFNLNEDDIRKIPNSMNRLKVASEKAKISLSDCEKTEIFIDEFYNDQILNIELTRNEFENICQDLFGKLIKPLDQILKDKKKNPSDIQEVILVGASTKIPKIKEIIRNYFKDVNINDYINPNETVAKGAAIQAAKLINKKNNNLKNIILLDIVPFSLGTNIFNFSKDPEIKQKGSLMNVMIKKGEKIPCKKAQIYETSYDNQNEITIRIYEGEEKYTKDNHFLGQFDLINLPRKPKGEVKFECSFNIDIDGILFVKFEEISSKISNSIKIINDKGIQNEKDNILNNKNIIINEDKNFEFEKNLKKKNE